MNSIKFQSNRDGGWQGNGYGHAPNTYKVIVDGVHVADAVYGRFDRWNLAAINPCTVDDEFYDGDETIDMHCTFAGLKAIVRMRVSRGDFDEVVADAKW